MRRPVPNANGSPWTAITYALPGPTDVGAEPVTVPLGIRVVCNQGPAITVLTCVASQTWVPTDDGPDVGEFVVSDMQTGNVPGPNGPEEHVAPPAGPTYVPAGSIVVDVWSEP